MTALAANTPHTYGRTEIERLPVEATGNIFAGATLQWDKANGGVQAYASGTVDFAGFSAERADNVAGALGDKVIDVHVRGKVVLVLAATVTLSSIGAIVYAQADDATFNLTSSGGMPIGKVSRVITAGSTGANEVEVAFESAGTTSV